MTIQDQLCADGINDQTSENLLALLLVDGLTHKIMSIAKCVGIDSFDLNDIVKEDMTGEPYESYKECRAIKKMVGFRSTIIEQIKFNENNAALWMGAQDKWIMAIRPIVAEHLDTIEITKNEALNRSRHRVTNMVLEGVTLIYDMTIHPDGEIIVNSIMINNMSDEGLLPWSNLNKVIRICGVVAMFDAAAAYNETPKQ